MTGDITIPLAMISFFFTLLWIFKNITKIKFCVLCGSVSLTWIILLILFWLNLFTNQAIIALLVGSSTVGLFYLVEKKLNDKYHLFRLPFFLTLAFTGYAIIDPRSAIESYYSILLISILWLLFLVLFLSINNPTIKKTVDSLIDCCKNW
jgi:hypothetical protein